MAKKSYSELKRQMADLLHQQHVMEEKAVTALTAAIMKSDAKELLAELSGAELQAVARRVAGSLGGVIGDVRAERAAAKAEQTPPAPTGG